MKDILFLTRGTQSSWIPPTNKILAYFHGGRIFTETLPLLARIGLVVTGVFVGLWWVAYWGVIFRDYERWSLVSAALVHLACLAIAYLYGRIVWLRLDHLRRIPPGEQAALRSFPILARLTGEQFLIGAISATFVATAMPAPSEPAALASDGTLTAMASTVSNPFGSLTLGVGSSLMVAFWSLLLLVFLYGVANAIETYLAIELNTRNHPPRSPRHDDLVREAGD